MELSERIALARKQAGLSQEQLGDQLGVSRQAVSKWESGQTNPDIQYIAAMCRLLEISSDWLLLGEATGQAAESLRCSKCAVIVTPMDDFCPKCGTRLHKLGGDRYAVVLSQVYLPSELSNLLFRCYQKECIAPPSLANQPVTHKLCIETASSLPSPCLLYRDLTPQQAARVHEQSFDAGTLAFFREDEARTQPSDFLPEEAVDPAQFVPSRPGMTFGDTVGAVILGVIAAVLLLSFL